MYRTGKEVLFKYSIPASSLFLNVRLMSSVSERFAIVTVIVIGVLMVTTASEAESVKSFSWA